MNHLDQWEQNVIEPRPMRMENIGPALKVEKSLIRPEMQIRMSPLVRVGGGIDIWSNISHWLLSSDHHQEFFFTKLMRLDQEGFDIYIIRGEK